MCETCLPSLFFLLGDGQIVQTVSTGGTQRSRTIYKSCNCEWALDLDLLSTPQREVSDFETKAVKCPRVAKIYNYSVITNEQKCPYFCVPKSNAFVMELRFDFRFITSTVNANRLPQYAPQIRIQSYNGCSNPTQPKAINNRTG